MNATMLPHSTSANDAPLATYEPPAVTYEALLEVRAGSPLGIPDPLDLTD